MARFYKSTQKQSIYGYWNMCGIYKCEENGCRGRGDALSSCGTRMRFFQEHELAPIDTNAYVMGIGNHEKHEMHERDGILAVKSDDKISDFFVCFVCFVVK